MLQLDWFIVDHVEPYLAQLHAVFVWCVHVMLSRYVRIPRTRKIYDITTIFAKQNYSQSKVFFVNNLVRVRTTFRRPARQNLVRIRMICFS